MEGKFIIISIRLLGTLTVIISIVMIDGIKPYLKKSVTETWYRLRYFV